VTWVRDLAVDLPFAVRSLLRSPFFTLTAIFAVALGIGVNTAVFSVIYPVLLDPLPYRDPARLVHIAETHPEFPSLQVSAPDYLDWQRSAHSFESIAAHTFQAMNQVTLTGDGEPEPVQIVQASWQLFPMLGIQPLSGRAYTAEEELRKAAVVLISESLWRRKYHADPHIVGRRIVLTSPFTVIGVVPTRQAEPRWADLWMPYSFLDPALVETRRFHPLEVIARLSPGVPIERAQAEMRGIAVTLGRAYPATNGNIGALVLPLAGWMTGEVRAGLLIAWAAVGLVLLLACANVAHLVLVRTADRTREMAVRAALGAGSARLARFLLTENLAVAAAGGVAGALLAALCLPILDRMADGRLPRVDSISLSPAVLLFGAAATLIGALLFALPAILHSRTPDLYQVIKQSGSLTASRRHPWFGSAIVAAEIALAFVVVTGAGLLYGSFAALVDEHTGFQSRGVIAAEVPLGTGLQTLQGFEQQIASRLRSLPGVTLVSAVNSAPMMLQASEVSRFATRFGVAGRSYEQGRFPVAQTRWSTPGYFRTLGIPLVSGREFTAADANQPGWLINQTLARTFFPGQDPVGRQILMNVMSAKPDVAPILGVVGDVRDLALELEPRPTLYALGLSPRMTVLVRADADPASLAPAVRAALRAANPQAPIGRLAPLDGIIHDSLARRRFALELLGVFAGLAALLTAVGVYGVISYSLSRRTGEFAIRFALGAGRAHVCRLVIRDVALPALAGLGLGGALALLFARALRSQLYKLSPADPRVLAATAAALLLLVLASAVRPAAKASSISPASLPRE
jgi:predicted permease